MSMNDCPHHDKIIEHGYRISGLEKDSVATKAAVERLSGAISSLTANINQIKWLIAGGLLASLGSSAFGTKLVALLI